MTTGKTDTVSFERNIRNLFTFNDVQCMKNRNVHLHNYGWMSDPDHARSVYDRLTRPEGDAERMPEGGPYWTAESIELFRRWMDDGFQP